MPPDQKEGIANSTPIQIKLKSESIFLRLWIFLKSVFSGVKKDVIYNDFLIEKKSKLLQRKYPDIYDWKRNSLINGFFSELQNLHKAINFFKSCIASYEESPGETYVFLGSLFISDLYDKLEAEVIPTSLPYSKEPTQELRTSLLRRLEENLSGISYNDKQVIYQNVQSLEWIKQLTKLPVERFLTKFGNYDHSNFFCPIENVFSEINQFVKVLCYPKNISPELLETLFILAKGFNTKENSPEKLAEEAKVFHNQSLDAILVINNFIRTIPLKTIALISSKNAEWTLPNPEGVEDWFVKFKAQWRKKFDKGWETWLTDRKKEEIRSKVEKLFGEQRLPLVSTRPWTKIWDGIPCAKDFTLGFLHFFFIKVYPNIAPILRVLLLEGDFVLREVRVELTNCCNEFAQESENVETIITKLSEDGSYYDIFENIKKEKLRTIQNQSRMDSLMLSIETDITMAASKFGTTCKEVIGIL